MTGAPNIREYMAHRDAAQYAHIFFCKTNFSCISHLNNLNLRIRLTHIRETFESAYGKH